MGGDYRVIVTKWKLGSWFQSGTEKKNSRLSGEIQIKSVVNNSTAAILKS